MYILRVEYKISDCIFLIKNIIISMQFQQINIVRKYCSFSFSTSLLRQRYMPVFARYSAQNPW